MDFNILNRGNMSDAEFAGHSAVELPVEDKTTLPMKRDPFDPEHLVKLLAKYEGEIAKMEATALAHEVKDDDSNELAVTYTTQAKALRNKIDKKHKEAKAPYLVVTNALDGFRKRLSDRIQGIEIALNNKIRPYLQKKEKERQETEKKAREEAARIQAIEDAKAKAEADRLADEARQKALAENKSKDEAEAAAVVAAAMAEAAPVVVAEAQQETKTVTETGTAALKKEWTWSIIDFKALPHAAFLARSEEVTKALAPYFNAQVKAGIRNIPGIKIFEQAVISTRTRR